MISEAEALRRLRVSVEAAREILFDPKYEDSNPEEIVECLSKLLGGQSIREALDHSAPDYSHLPKR